MATRNGWWWPHRWGEYAARALIRLTYRALRVTPPEGSVLNDGPQPSTPKPTVTGGA